MTLLEDLMTRERAEQERILAMAIVIGGVPLFQKLRADGWWPEVAADVQQFWQAAQHIALDENFGERCVKVILSLEHGLDVWCAWIFLYAPVAVDQGHDPLKVAESTLREIRGCKVLVTLLQHFAYVLEEQKAYGL